MAQISPGLAEADDDQIAAALLEADPMVLRGLVYHATGDEELAELGVTRIPGLFMDAPWIEDEETLAELRGKAAELLRAYRDGTLEPPADAGEERILRSMGLVVDDEVPAAEFGYWNEELAIDPTQRRHNWAEEPDPAELEKFEVLVVGAGLGGLNAAVQLKMAGFNFQVLEKNGGVGGTWYMNRYPGARVDLPSRMYSHSVAAAEFHFKHPFAPRDENEEYVNWLTDKFGVRDHIRFNTEVLDLSWNDEASHWEAAVRRADGTEDVVLANAVICAVGFLCRPSIPEFPGLEEFEGEIVHTTEFTPDIELDGKRAAVIGTGASGMQMVPDLLPLVDQLTIFQRSPGWVIPVPGYRDPYSPGAFWLHENLPYYSNWTRFSQAWAIGDHVIFDIWSVDPEWTEPNTLNADNYKMRQKLVAYMEEKIGDRPDLVEKLLPQYPPLSKRYVVDNGWYDAVRQDNVEIVDDDPIERFTKAGVVTASGREIPLDVAVFATGFRANDFFWPMQVKGRGGVSVEELWAKDGARAYWGMIVAGLPNFFAMYGPNANPKNTGPVPYGELQVRYILKCLEAMFANEWKSLEIRADVYEDFQAKLDERLSTSIFLDPRQKSYYTNDSGRSAVASPWATLEYYEKTLEPDFDEFVIEEREAADPRASEFETA